MSWELIESACEVMEDLLTLFLDHTKSESKSFNVAAASTKSFQESSADYFTCLQGIISSFDVNTDTVAWGGGSGQR